mgnify:CR=1 FL=1
MAKIMKTLGIIGGLGPETTANFFMEVILSCAELNKLHRPSILIANVPIEFKLEEDFIKHSKGKRKLLSLLIDSAIRLEKGGADFIVIPCNTVHVFIGEIRKAVNIPVLSIIDEAVDFLNERNTKNVGLLATPSTIKNRLFDSKLKTNSIQMEIPDERSQKKLGEIINKILRNTHNLNDKKDLTKIINRFSSDLVLLACTDLHILIPIKENPKILDTMQILKNAAVRELLKPS